MLLSNSKNRPFRTFWCCRTFFNAPLAWSRFLRRKVSIKIDLIEKTKISEFFSFRDSNPRFPDACSDKCHSEKLMYHLKNEIVSSMQFIYCLAKDRQMVTWIIKSWATVGFNIFKITLKWIHFDESLQYFFLPKKSTFIQHKWSTCPGLFIYLKFMLFLNPLGNFQVFWKWS